MVSTCKCAALGAAFVLFSVASADDAPKIKTYSLGDGSLYAKTLSNLLGTTQEEAGVNGPLATYGSWSLKYNAAYLINYPIETTGVKPLWLAGVGLSYQLSPLYFKPSLYTKTKWYTSGKRVEESGLTFSWRKNHYGLTANAGYVFGYRYGTVAKPSWQVALALNYFFKSQ